MHLFGNPSPRLTRWVVHAGVLEQPFVLLDIGVQGGIHPRWEALGDKLRVYGFDALPEAIHPLENEGRPGHRYFAQALGNEDGERTIYVPSVRESSSLYAGGQSRYAVASGVEDRSSERKIAINRLDTLIARGVVPRPDFIKIDCEGAEPEILVGARATLTEQGVLGVELETNFNVSPLLPETHFWASHRALSPAGLLLFDLAFERTPLRSFNEAVRRLRRPPARLVTVARPSTFNALFCRDFVFERASPGSFPDAPRSAPSADQLIKLAVIFELYGMLDAAYDLLAAFPQTLGNRLTTDQAASLLIPSWRQLSQRFLARLRRRASYELRSKRWRRRR